uniref:Phosphatidylinositol transfer protein n=1 Tax=Meloidogyne hapla TaxID=6305 RepID=A0A1I8BK49_MELHA
MSVNNRVFLLLIILFFLYFHCSNGAGFKNLLRSMTDKINDSITEIAYKKDKQMIKINKKIKEIKPKIVNFAEDFVENLKENFKKAKKPKIENVMFSGMILPEIKTEEYYKIQVMCLYENGIFSNDKFCSIPYLVKNKFKITLEILQEKLPKNKKLPAIFVNIQTNGFSNRRFWKIYYPNFDQSYKIEYGASSLENLKINFRIALPVKYSNIFNYNKQFKTLLGQAKEEESEGDDYWILRILDKSNPSCPNCRDKKIKRKDGKNCLYCDLSSETDEDKNEIKGRHTINLINKKNNNLMENIEEEEENGTNEIIVYIEDPVFSDKDYEFELLPILVVFLLMTEVFIVSARFLKRNGTVETTTTTGTIEEVENDPAKKKGKKCKKGKKEKWCDNWCNSYKVN